MERYQHARCTLPLIISPQKFSTFFRRGTTLILPYTGEKFIELYSKATTLDPLMQQASLPHNFLSQNQP
jgi:hypothetical protein